MAHSTGNWVIAPHVKSAALVNEFFDATIMDELDKIAGTTSLVCHILGTHSILC